MSGVRTGENNSFYFAEEMKSTYEYKKMIHADDRATMLNLMVGLNGYTLCSGIICEELNGNDYAGSAAGGERKDADRLYPAQGDKGQSDRRIICGYSEKSGKPL